MGFDKKTDYEEFLEFKLKLIEERLIVYDNARIEYIEAFERLNIASNLLKEARSITEEAYFNKKK